MEINNIKLHVYLPVEGHKGIWVHRNKIFNKLLMKVELLSWDWI
jgi:hypothetical protein